MTNPEWAQYIVQNVHADTAAMGLLIADEAQRSRRVQLEAAHRQVEATERQTSAVRETAQQTQDTIVAASDRQVDAQQETTRTIDRLGQTVEAATNRLDASIDRGLHQVQETMHQGFDILDRKLTVLAGVMDGGFDMLGQRLVEQTDVLGDIATMTANPLATAAAEHYRRGVTSLEQEWLDEAVPEFELAIEKDRTNPAPRYALGLAQSALNDFKGAFDSLGLAVKYSTVDPKWGPLAASAAMLQRSIATPEQSAQVEQTIDTALRVAPDCAELRLTRAAQHGTQDDLIRAFTIAPELSLVAIQGGLTGAEDAAKLVYDEAHSPVRAGVEIRRIIDKSGDHAFGPNAVPADLPQAMIGFPTWASTALPVISEYVSRAVPNRIRAAEISVDEARAELVSALSDLGRAQSNLDELEQERTRAEALKERTRQSVVAFESLPSSRASVEHEIKLRGAFRPFVLPSLLLVVLLLFASGAGRSNNGFLGFTAFVVLVVLVVRLRKSFRALAEIRETASRERQAAVELKGHQIAVAASQADAALRAARDEFVEASNSLSVIELKATTASFQVEMFSDRVPALEKTLAESQTYLTTLLEETDRIHNPILRLLPYTEVHRVYPLGDGPDPPRSERSQPNRAKQRTTRKAATMTDHPSGWYDDGLHAGHQRYWDGAQWTDNFHPPLGETSAVQTVTATDVKEYAATPADENDVVAILNAIKNDSIATGMLLKHKVTSKVNKRRQETEASFTASLKSVKNYWVKIDVIKTAYGVSWSADNGLWNKDGAARGGRMGIANELAAGGGIVSGLIGGAMAKSAEKAAAKDAQRAQSEFDAFQSTVLSKYFS